VVITAFACGETERIFRGERSRKLPPDIEHPPRGKLEYLHRARTLRDFTRPATGWKPSRAVVQASTAFASTTSGGFASSGAVPTRSR